MRISSRNLFTPQLKVTVVVAMMSIMKEEASILSKALLKVKVKTNLKAVQFGEKYKEKLPNEKK